MSNKPLLLITGIAVIVIGFILTSGDFLNNLIEDHPILGIITPISGIVLIIAVANYNKVIVRLAAGLFPVLLILTIVFNLTEEKVGWRLKTKSSNTIFELSEAVPKYQLYAYLQDNFTDWTLLVSPEALELSKLVDWQLMEWGRLRSIQLEERNHTLAEGNFAKLLDQPHIAIRYGKQDYIVIELSMTSDNSDHTLVLIHDGGRNFLIPINQFSVLEGVSQ